MYKGAKRHTFSFFIFLKILKMFNEFEFDLELLYDQLFKSLG